MQPSETGSQGSAEHKLLQCPAGRPHDHADLTTVKPVWNFCSLELLDEFVVLATYFVVFFPPTVIGSQAGIIVTRTIMLKSLKTI